MENTREKINQVIGTYDDGSIVVLDEFFEYADSFRGATGSVIVPVGHNEIERALTEDEKAEYYEEHWRMDAGSTNGTTMSLEDWAQEIDDDEYLDSRFEPYDDIDVEEIALAVGTEVPERYTITGLGRMFPHAINDPGFTPLDTDEVRALIARIREVEA